MTILSMMQDLSYELGIRTPATVIGNTDPEVLQLLYLLYREGKELKMSQDWVQLQKEHTFSTVNGTAAYALPADFERFLYSTNWDRTNKWQLIGPLSAEEWQVYKSGIVSTGPRARFRIKGFSDTQFYLDPTPGSADSLVYEYISASWLRPKVWTTGTVFAAGTYSSYNGNIYYTTAGGTTGATPPTWTSGSSSDGAVTWTYVVGQLYQTATADTDFAIISERVVQLGVQWRYKRAKGLSYEDIRAEQRYALEQERVAYQGARKLSLANNTGFRLIDTRDVPDTGYGS